MQEMLGIKNPIGRSTIGHVTKPEVDISHGPILYLEDISVSFDGFKALNGLCLTVDAGELNEWRRGFTPQAEIWNGRLAMLGLSLGLLTLILVRLFSEGISAS